MRWHAGRLVQGGKVISGGISQALAAGPHPLVVRRGREHLRRIDVREGGDVHRAWDMARALTPRVFLSTPIHIGRQAVNDHNVRLAKRTHHVLFRCDPICPGTGGEYGSRRSWNLGGKRAPFSSPLAQTSVEDM